ncbi:MAG: PEGA domain-containing protein [Armatimonadetes bacterium]|nr:PEGA domain-containing protein [Armatimonadota bacterium]MDW8027946.1 PEGA domain-containing protein [Armatimonadota bacterium]
MRKPFSVFAIAFALFQFGCGGGGQKQEKPKPTNGSLFSIAVQSTPVAEIWLDGRQTGFRSNLLGTEPISLPLVLTETQPHLLTLKAEGFHDWHQWVERTSEGSVIVQARLRPKSEQNGSLVISSEPQGAKIFLNGTDTGRTTPATLTVSPSSHAIKVELTGFLPGYETVFVPSGEQIEVHIPLQPQNKGVVSGVVYDRFGVTPAHALLKLQTRQGEIVATTRSSAYGLFQFPPVPPSTYIVTAEITVEGDKEVGQLENVIVDAGKRTFVSLVVFPADLFGTVEGTVKTPDSKPIPNAQVSVLYYAAELDFVLTSRRTLTDNQGRFRIENVPTATQVIVVRKEGYQSAQTQAIVRKNEIASVEIILQPLGTLPTLQPPTRVFAIAYTVPTEFWQSEEGKGQGAKGEKRSAEFYRKVLASLLRRFNHPAAKILEKLSRTEQIPSRFFPFGFIGSVGIGWQPPLSIPSQGLLGYRIYRSIPTSTGWKLRLVIDEPEQTTAEDVAFDFTPGQTYQYAVSAIGLDGKETSKSELAQATFLPPIRSLEPADNAQVAQSELQFRWTPVNGLVPFYFVQLYGDLDALLFGNPVWSTDAISGTTQATYDGQPLLKGKTYWWLVIGTDERDWHDARSFTVSAARQVVIVGD